MKHIYTICATIEEAKDLEDFIMRKKYEGVQNDSNRYNDVVIWAAFKEMERHHLPHIYIGVNGCQLVVDYSKKYMRKKCSKHYIRKPRVFKELLSLA